MPIFVQPTFPAAYPNSGSPFQELQPNVRAFMFGYYNQYADITEPIMAEGLAVEASTAYMIPGYAGSNSNSPAIQWTLTYPIQPAAVNVLLEGTTDTVWGPWIQIGISTNPAGDSQTIDLGTTKFLAVRTRVVSYSNAGSPPVASEIVASVMI